MRLLRLAEHKSAYDVIAHSSDKADLCAALLCVYGKIERSATAKCLERCYAILFLSDHIGKYFSDRQNHNNHLHNRFSKTL